MSGIFSSYVDQPDALAVNYKEAISAVHTHVWDGGNFNSIVELEEWLEKELGMGHSDATQTSRRIRRENPQLTNW